MVASLSSLSGSVFCVLVSIPFIAGQWSLRFASSRYAAYATPRLNPLHCGAVVASIRFLEVRGVAYAASQSPSLRGSGRFSLAWGTRVSTSSCFNPLHCGAVVASAESRTDVVERIEFQSPSLRGSGRFSVKPSGQPSTSLGFNPLHCGAVVASVPGNQAMACSTRVSIPFIAGQWSLPLRRISLEVGRRWFQSPSLRGSGRFAPPAAGGRGFGEMFQSPSLRGSGRFTLHLSHCWPQLSFNPLHCGAVVASIVILHNETA